MVQARNGIYGVDEILSRKNFGVSVFSEYNGVIPEVSELLVSQLPNPRSTPGDFFIKINMDQKRVVVFIDGFNLYHAVQNNFSPRYKWCNLRKLVTQFIDVETDVIKQIYFFTAYCTWDKGKLKRHKDYVKILREYCGVYSVFGKYRRVKRGFSRPMPIFKIVPRFLKPLIQKLTYLTYEEKETDVNMALKIVELGFLNQYDHAIILSGDSDLIGAIKTIRRNFPDKKFTNLLPIKAKGWILQKASDNRHQIEASHFHNALLPDEITLRSGEIIQMPEKYQDPKIALITEQEEK